MTKGLFGERFLDNTEEELEKIGLTKDILDVINSLSPSHQIMVGYPQERIDYFIIHDNW
mgnify:CR=1 FL=1